MYLVRNPQHPYGGSGTAQHSPMPQPGAQLLLLLLLLLLQTANPEPSHVKSLRGTHEMKSLYTK